MNIPEKIVNEWFNRLDKGYAVEPYTKRELRILHNVIKDNAELIHEQLYGDGTLLTEATFLRPKYKPGHQIEFSGGRDGKPPKWAPNLKVGDILTIVQDDESLYPTNIAAGQFDEDKYKFKKTLELPNGSKVRIADKIENPSYSKKFRHMKGGKSIPNAIDWESLIVVAYNEKLEGSEWDKVGRFWEDYKSDVQKVADALREKIKSSELRQFGADSVDISKEWEGTNTTPKTDILGNNDDRISLKKRGGSQLMSGGGAETYSTFSSAKKYYSKYESDEIVINGLDEFLGIAKEKMNPFKIKTDVRNIKAKLFDKYREYRFEEIKSELKDKGISATDNDIEKHIKYEASLMYFYRKGKDGPISGLDIPEKDVDEIWKKINTGNTGEELQNSAKTVLEKSIDSTMLETILEDVFIDTTFKKWVVYEAATGTFKFTGDVALDTTSDPVANKIAVFSESGDVEVKDIDIQWAEKNAKKVTTSVSFKSSNKTTTLALRMLINEVVDGELNMLNENITKIVTEAKVLLNEGWKFGEMAIVKLKNVFLTIWKGIKNLIKKFYNNVILKMFNKLKELAKKGVDSLMKFFGITADFTGSSIDVSF